MRYIIATYHGELKSVYHIVDTQAEDAPEILGSTSDRKVAQDIVNELNSSSLVSTIQ